MRHPLDGITVVTLEQAVAAPFATRQLVAGQDPVLGSAPALGEHTAAIRAEFGA